MRSDSRLALSILALLLIASACAEENVSSRVYDATVTRDVIATESSSCKSGMSDQLALIMSQQRYMGSGTTLPTTILVPEPTSGGWITYNPRVAPNVEPHRARGYLISVCSALSYLRERTSGEPDSSFTFWSLPLSHTAEGAFGNGLLSTSWNRRDDSSYILAELTAGLPHEIWEGSDAARTIGTVSVSDPGGRATTFEETWWLMCVPRGVSPNDVHLPEAWHPVIWREGQIARCSN